MWTAKNRGRYDRSKLRYPSDLTDDEWAHVEPLIPPTKRGGNKRHVEVREVMNGIMYILSTGCQWRAIPKDLPPRSTLFDYRDGGSLLLATLFRMFPFLKKLFADGGYQGPDFQKALAKILPQLETEIVKRSDRTKGFVVLPRRWVVERTFAWLNRCRRLAK